MRVLVDTNIWIDHFNCTDDKLVALLKERKVVAHPLVRGELGCGNLARRDLILEFLAEMPQADEVTIEEMLHMVGERKLFGKGIGLMDCLLLGSALVGTRTYLWTRDKRLARAAEEAGVGFEEE